VLLTASSSLLNRGPGCLDGEPDPELLELVDAYTKMDGSAERLNEAITLMGKFCRQSRKPAK